MPTLPIGTEDEVVREGLRSPKQGEDRRFICTYEHTVQLVGRIIQKLEENYNGKPLRDRIDVIVGVSRGGLVPTAILAEASSIRNVVTVAVASYDGESVACRRSTPDVFNFPQEEKVAGQRVLLVDDVWDSGDTLVAVRNRLLAAGALEVVVAVLHFKPRNNQHASLAPDVFAEICNDWIVYPWKPLALRNHIPCR